MNARKLLRSALVVAAFAVCASAQAAGLFRAYLASDGLDSNPCTLAAPCRLLPAALAAVTDGGEIWMLDSANYNTATVNITKSVTILAIPGAVGSVVAISGGAIEVSTPGTSVALRNLLVVPFSPPPGPGGPAGINVTGAAKVAIEDTVISGLTQDGISVSSQTAVRITNCIIRDNGGTGVDLAGGATAEISGSKITGNVSGVEVFGAFITSLTTSAAISDSILSANGAGLVVRAFTDSSKARASITRSTLSGNLGCAICVQVSNGTSALATVGSSMVTGNGTGLSQSGVGATIETLGDNIVRQNTTATSGTITTVPPL